LPASDAYVRLVARAVAVWLVVAGVVLAIACAPPRPVGLWGNLTWTVALFGTLGAPLLILVALVLTVAAIACRPRRGPDGRWQHLSQAQVTRRTWACGIATVVVAMAVLAVVAPELLAWFGSLITTR